MSQPEFEYLGPYRVESVLGRGGMGTVYKGAHTRSGEKVAIKVIAAGVANQSRFRRRFAAEIDTLQRLKHPHIVELVGYGEEQGLLFYSMEYVAGHSLLDHMRQHKSLPWEDVLQIGIETASALKHAHDLGIIHRDLKPANLMLNEKGQIKLTDFGIAKLFGSTDMTAAGAVIGTADYMPPEQAEGKTVTTRSDLYSLGCVLYALLTGRAPFGGKSVPEVLYAVRYNPIPDLLSLAPLCPPEFAALIKEMLEKDPLKRPPTALVVGNRLKAIQAGMRKIGGAGKSKGEPIAAEPEPVAKELTSLDLSDAEDEEIRLTHPEMESPHEQPTMLAPQPQSSDVNTNCDSIITDHGITSVVPNPAAPNNALPAIVTERSNRTASPMQPRTHLPMSADEPLSNAGPSRFTHVSEADSRASVFGTNHNENAEHSDWLQYISIAVMGCALVACLAFLWWTFQPKTADQLYEQISSLTESNDESDLVAARPTIDEFLERFPSDPRTSELQAVADDLDLTKAHANLQRKASRSGDSFSALEQAFLDCLDARDRDFAIYQRKLKAFLAVYGELEGLTRQEKRLVELARFAENVKPNTKAAVPAATLQLEKLIRSAEGELRGEALLAYYRNLLVLYDGKPWATEQLERVRERIQTGTANGK